METCSDGLEFELDCTKGTGTGSARDLRHILMRRATLSSEDMTKQLRTETTLFKRYLTNYF
ncbi:hypothetical protein MAR_005630 [Mya arenaria]|uniref:Uncharacterized protein n=1 Tax=Mya arenaria TaxID=6604 RepID=A0ABY7F023_MYAAR|nr:hypothetical protein MAR_005630 [Mya arenaria]